MLGFALSFEQYKELKELVLTGLEVEAFLNADFGTNSLEVIEATVSNSLSRKPIVLTAHLCHPKPGANDNTSGSALLTEIVSTSKIANIEREVVALWVPEMYGRR